MGGRGGNSTLARDAGWNPESPNAELMREYIGLLQDERQAEGRQDFATARELGLRAESILNQLPPGYTDDESNW